MQNFINPKSEVTVAKTIPELTNLMNGIFHHGKGTYNLLDHNPGFNLYRLSTLEGLTAMTLSVQLQSIDAQNTKIIFEAMRPAGGSASQQMLQTAMDGLMSILGRAINGEEITPQMIKANSNNSGCVWTIILLVIAAILLFIFFK